jgi:26S proteasome regulatory subunit N11
MEVMGLMLGEAIDDFTVRVVDVFAMPQSGTGVSVEAVDPVFQANMIEMLKQTGRPEMVVGWYHSHPGFGCWLSGVDVNTAQSFEQLNPRSVALVVDPIQSVKGKVVVDAFRCISPQMVMMGQEPRQTTSVVGHLNKPSIQALIHGLNRSYYSIPIAYRKNELETKMLMNLHKRRWTKGLTLARYAEQAAANATVLADLAAQADAYGARVVEEEGKSADEVAVLAAGKADPKKRMEAAITTLMTNNLAQCLGGMLDTVVF